MHIIFMAALLLAIAAVAQDEMPLCQQLPQESDLSSLLGVSRQVLKHNDDTDTLLSRRDSLGFIAENGKSWSKRKQIHREQMERELSNTLDSCPENRCDGWGHVWFQEHYEPSFHCEFEERIGQTGDGGKWVCDPSQIRKAVKSGKEKCLVYSVGSNGDFSFEESVLSQISKDCEVHTFDPEKAGTWTVPDGVQYHSVALGTSDAAKPLSQIVKELGHVGRKIDLFKIDCEGCEWDTFKSWFGSGVDIRQILVELHWRAHPEVAHEFFRFLFQQGYVIFNKEPNTLGCQGECIEYAFLKMAPSFSHDI